MTVKQNESKTDSVPANWEALIAASEEHANQLTEAVKRVTTKEPTTTNVDTRGHGPED
jgi:hypothetical protein